MPFTPRVPCSVFVVEGGVQQLHLPLVRPAAAGAIGVEVSVHDR
jgi:hypothetical protein